MLLSILFLTIHYKSVEVEKNIEGIKADIEGFGSRLGFTSHFEQEAKVGAQYSGVES